MSSAYCMTCNDQVLDLAGSCPEGHRIGGEDTSPAPWVGHANAAGSREPATPPPSPPAVQPIPAASHANGNGHSNGNGNGHTQPAPAVSQVTSFTPSDVDEVGGRSVHRAPATGEAADELAAMLASALASSPASDSPATNHATNHAPPATADPGTSGDLDGPWVGSAGDRADEPTDSSGPTLPWTDSDLGDLLSSTTAGSQPEADTTASALSDREAAGADQDWGDLASLAAELQLDGPMARTRAEEVMPPPSPDTRLSASDSLVDLPPPAPPAPAAPAATMPAVDANDTSDLDALSDQDLAALYESAVGQHLGEDEHVPSQPTAPPGPAATEARAVTVDLANFTARGNSVARNSAAERRFGRKR